jgi:ubiquinone/menaquinone biosynthesis C-methylase UbiE
VSAPPVTRGRLFDRVAQLYDEVRPDYPEGFYVAIESMTGALDGKHVLDLAAGPGVATRQLLSRGADVVALDPGRPLLTQLRSRSQTAKCVEAAAEALPFRDHVFDVATCATGWHWVEADPAARELRRVLRPGGFVALWWANHRRDDSIPWEAAQGAVHDRWSFRTGSRPPHLVGVHPRDAARHLRSVGWKVLVDTEFRWSRVVPTDLHLRVLRTHSDTLALGDAAEPLLAEVADALAPYDEVEERLWGPLVVAQIG